MLRTTLFGCLTFAAITTGAQAGPTVTQTDDATTLANTILGSGITINSASTTGASNAFGTFTNGSSVGGGFFDQGIIMSSGTATDAEGPNSADNTTTNFSTSGDSDLDSLTTGSTNDAAVFEIDFTSDGGDLAFNFIFASEEYNEFVGTSFNDVFGFFLNGTNIAKIPGTNDPVTINNVNNSSNSGVFNDNDPSDTNTPFDIEYDGFTDTFTAQASNLPSGQNTLKLAVADTSDSILDSAVFVQGGTLSDEPTTPVPVPATIGLFSVGLFGLGFIARRRSA